MTEETLTAEEQEAIDATKEQQFDGAEAPVTEDDESVEEDAEEPAEDVEPVEDDAVRMARMEERMAAMEREKKGLISDLVDARARVRDTRDQPQVPQPQNSAIDRFNAMSKEEQEEYLEEAPTRQEFYAQIQAQNDLIQKMGRNASRPAQTSASEAKARAVAEEMGVDFDEVMAAADAEYADDAWLRAVDAEHEDPFRIKLQIGLASPKLRNQAKTAGKKEVLDKFGKRPVRTVGKVSGGPTGGKVTLEDVNRNPALLDKMSSAERAAMLGNDDFSTFG